MVEGSSHSVGSKPFVILYKFNLNFIIIKKNPSVLLIINYFLINI
jgi:hypothetical protein